MSEDYFEILTKKIQVLIGEFNILKERIAEVERRENKLNTAFADLGAQQVDLNKREAEVNQRHSKLIVIKEEAQNRIKEQEIREKRLLEATEQIKKDRESLEKRFSQFDKLEIEARNLKDYEAQLEVLSKSIKDREFLVEKEKLIDRERKAILDKREADLDAEKERIQRLAER